MSISRKVAALSVSLATVASVASGVALDVAPASATASPASIDFGDVPFGTQGTPVKTITLTAHHPLARFKSVFDDSRFRIVEREGCVPFESTSCTIKVAPFWPPYGWEPQAGPITVFFPVVWTYGDNHVEQIAVSANLLPRAPAVVSVDDVAVQEAFDQYATFTLTRTGDISVTSTVYWSTADGSAQAPGDYQPQPPTKVTFDPGVASVSVSVRVIADGRHECHEEFTVELSSPSEAAIGDGSGRATIADHTEPGRGELPDLFCPPPPQEA